MDKHTIPRQITTFEFKLIGFFTARQFVYLVIFALLAVLTYFFIPIRYLNIAAGASVFGLGLFFALVKYNDRSLDVWLINMVRSITSPSQYYYKKQGGLPEYFTTLPITTPDLKNSHVDAQKKLTAYLSADTITDDNRKQNILSLIKAVSVDQKTAPPPPESSSRADVQPRRSTTQPFLSGVLKNHQEFPLPNIMVYLKDTKGEIIRILKSNSRGVFASFHPLAKGNYFLEPKDPEEKYFFDTMNLAVNGAGSLPLVIHSKELL